MVSGLRLRLGLLFGLELKLVSEIHVTIMHTQTNGVLLVINSRLLQVSMKLADWRIAIPWLLGLRCQLASCCRVSAAVRQAPFAETRP